MSRLTFAGKLYDETVTLTFDFTSRLAASETLSSPTANSVVYSGTDAAPSGLLYGSPAVSGQTVTQKVWKGTVGVTYLVKCTVTTSTSQILSLAGYVTVVPDQY